MGWLHESFDEFYFDFLVVSFVVLNFVILFGFFVQGGGDQSPNWQHKASVKSRSVGNRTNNGFISKQDGLSNGIAQSVQPDVSQTKMEKRSDIQGNEKVMVPLVLFCSDEYC